MGRDAETVEAALEAVKKIASSVIHTASGAYLYTSITRVIEEERGCFIHLVPVDDANLRGRTETWSRVLEIKVGSPKPTQFRKAEHWIVYDSRMPEAASARCIAHELYHILEHDPTSEGRQVGEEGMVQYTHKEEVEADLFSLVLLMNRAFGKNQAAPQSPEEFLKMIRTQAGLPKHISREDLERLTAGLGAQVST